MFGNVSALEKLHVTGKYVWGEGLSSVGPPPHVFRPADAVRGVGA